MAESKVGAEVKAWSPGLCPLPPLWVRKCQSTWVWTILGVVSGWVCPGQEWKVPESLASGGDGFRDRREQPGLSEEQEPPDSPKRLHMGQSLVSSGLWDPLVPGYPTHPAQERPRPCTPMRGTEVKGQECARGIQAPSRGLGEGVWGRPHVCSSRRQFVSEDGELAGLQLCASRRSCSTCSSWASGSSGAEGRCTLRAEQAGPHPPVPLLKVRRPLDLGLRSPTHSIPEGGSDHQESPDWRDLPSPGPVSTEPASVLALSSRCFSLWGRTG